jgi:hypothetical protein
MYYYYYYSRQYHRLAITAGARDSGGRLAAQGATAPTARHTVQLATSWLPDQANAFADLKEAIDFYH